ncbi:MAG: hypothetical protein JSY10_24980 [Paenibacillus sp.]|nr:hypothetical protein [Paenibacillus sp.]
MQARASTKIVEQLQYLREKIQFSDEEAKNLFEGTIDQTAKLAIFGFGPVKLQDNDANKGAWNAR